MQSQEYMKAAARTESIPASLEINEYGMRETLRLIVTAGKVVDMVKRHLYYGEKGRIHPGKFKELLVDLADTCDDLGVIAGDIGLRYNESEDLNRLDIRLTHATLGIFTESGEMAELLFSQMKGEPIDYVGFSEEIGDVDWYKAILHNVLNVNEPALRQMNIDKLRKRYPEKFNVDEATSRDLPGERSVLEDRYEGAFADTKPEPVESAGGHTD